MMNAYGIYISSLETGDTHITRTCSKYNTAITSLKKVTEDYIESRCLSQKSEIIAKIEFNFDHVRKRHERANGYFFCLGNDSVDIYRKTTDFGYFKNSTSLDKVAKIGICEITIASPIPEAPTFPSSEVYNPVNYNNNNSTTISIKTRDFDIVAQNTNRDNNFQHGKHVTFIEELKNRLADRRKVIKPLQSSTSSSNETKSYDQEKHRRQLKLKLSRARHSLKNAPRPVEKCGDKLGKIINIENKLNRTKSLSHISFTKDNKTKQRRMSL